MRALPTTLMDKVAQKGQAHSASVGAGESRGENGEEMSFNDAVPTKIAENFVALRPALSGAKQARLPGEVDFLDALSAVAGNLHKRNEMLSKNLGMPQTCWRVFVLVKH